MRMHLIALLVALPLGAHAGTPRPIDPSVKGKLELFQASPQLMQKLQLSGQVITLHHEQTRTPREIRPPRRALFTRTSDYNRGQRTMVYDRGPAAFMTARELLFTGKGLTLRETTSEVMQDKSIVQKKVKERQVSPDEIAGLGLNHDYASVRDFGNHGATLDTRSTTSGTLVDTKLLRAGAVEKAVADYMEALGRTPAAAADPTSPK
jgi:hypothetical protein